MALFCVLDGHEVDAVIDETTHLPLAAHGWSRLLPSHRVAASSV
ncbi:predicted protein [Plenodomus lingam JN3]|uniref:Uncharacterized protein n=1 Tax=Leptosphaeria maculans (strain JN3 / isolate v23.1.3 / race Av1-4-5-6-7-8) TaxID=985895 RepID=E5A6F2_LEPMJ|nr:predicted protein [Plenodomus lingam JN3]CBX99197.1 predicted protein [Plenodomus lingam JN3]